MLIKKHEKKMITFISIVILFLLILFTDFISYKRDRELKKRIFELEMKTLSLKHLMSDILDIFSENGQPRTKSECSDLPGNEEPGDTTNTNT